MMGPTHRVFGALCGAAVATYQGETFTMIAMTSLVATATAHGWSSPDVDQTEPWETVRAVLPRPAAKLMNHRALTHWIGVPALAWLGFGQLPPEAHMPAFALLIGWCSHLLGDFIFGVIPLLPWGSPKVGVGFKTGGFVEKWIALPACAFALVYLLYAPLARAHGWPI